MANEWGHFLFEHSAPLCEEWGRSEWTAMWYYMYMCTCSYQRMRRRMWKRRAVVDKKEENDRSRRMKRKRRWRVRRERRRKDIPLHTLQRACRATGDWLSQGCICKRRRRRRRKKMRSRRREGGGEGVKEEGIEIRRVGGGGWQETASMGLQ